MDEAPTLNPYVPMMHSVCCSAMTLFHIAYGKHHQSWAARHALPPEASWKVGLSKSNAEAAHS